MYLKAHSRQCYLIGAVFTTESLVCSQTSELTVNRKGLFRVNSEKIFEPQRCA